MWLVNNCEVGQLNLSYTCILFFLATSGFLTNMRSFFWIPVQQYTTRRISVKLFSHLHKYVQLKYTYLCIIYDIKNLTKKLILL